MPTEIAVEQLSKAMEHIHVAVQPPVYNLPVEILLYIFRLATTSPTSDQLVDKYRPFNNIPRQHLPPHQRLIVSHAEDLETVWKTKFSLVQVCKSWRVLAIDFAYEELVVGDSIRPLLQAFEASETASPGCGIGRKVRRIHLAAWRPETDHVPMDEILRWCPNVQLLLKNDDDLTPEPYESSNLSSIRRFDWMFDRFVEGERASRWQRNADGLDFLRFVVNHAPNLAYLCIGVRFPLHRISVQPASAITVSSLTSLCLQHIGSKIRAELEQWNFPKLTHIITDSSLIWDGYSSLFSPQITVVELFRDVSLRALEALSLMECCPNLKELNYYVEFASFPMIPATHDNIECVRLYAARNFVMKELAESCRHIEEQLTIYAGDTFPSLKRLVLCGDWQINLSNSGIRKTLDKFRDSHCSVEYPEGTLLQLENE